MQQFSVFNSLVFLRMFPSCFLPFGVCSARFCSFSRNVLRSWISLRRTEGEQMEAKGAGREAGRIADVRFLMQSAWGDGDGGLPAVGHSVRRAADGRREHVDIIPP